MFFGRHFSRPTGITWNLHLKSDDAYVLKNLLMYKAQRQNLYYKQLLTIVLAITGMQLSYPAWMQPVALIC